MGAWLERGFERGLWGARWAVLLAVVASLVASLAVFFLATVDTVVMVSHLVPYASASLADDARRAIYDETIRHVVKIVDAYLLGTVLLIVGFGLYELFLGKIDAAQESETRERVLVIKTLDDLKDRLVKVILMILVVSFFERVLRVRAENAADLLWIAGAIALVSLAVWLSHPRARH